MRFAFIRIFFNDVSHTHTHRDTHIYMRCKLGLFCEEIYKKTVYDLFIFEKMEFPNITEDCKS